MPVVDGSVNHTKERIEAAVAVGRDLLPESRPHVFVPGRWAALVSQARGGSSTQDGQHCHRRLPPLDLH